MHFGDRSSREYSCANANAFETNDADDSSSPCLHYLTYKFYALVCFACFRFFSSSFFFCFIFSSLRFPPHCRNTHLLLAPFPLLLLMFDPYIFSHLALVFCLTALFLAVTTSLESDFSLTCCESRAMIMKNDADFRFFPVFCCCCC